ncbi:hypothetical protein [Streptomyces sp. NPDC056240]
MPRQFLSSNIALSFPSEQSSLDGVGPSVEAASQPDLDYHRLVWTSRK